MKKFRINGLKKAAGDFRYLLNKGYPRERLLELIGDRYNLDYDRRHLLHRGVFSYQEVKERKKKLISPEKIKGKSVGIDGHNVLITIESANKGIPLIYSDDGLVRDIAGVSRKYRITEKSYSVLNLIFEVFKKYRPKEIKFFFDSPISRSGQLAEIVRGKIKMWGLSGDANAVKVPEKELVKYEVVATSDSALIDEACKVIDLAGYIVREKLNCKLVRL